eukprot:403369689
MNVLDQSHFPEIQSQMSETNLLDKEQSSVDENSKNISKKRRTKYLKIDDEKRRIIIFEVMIMNNPLKAVCEKHNINFSSAKNVVQIFKKEGRLEKKVVRARKTKRKGESKDDPDQSEENELPTTTDIKSNPTSLNLITKNNGPGILLKLMDDDTYQLIQKNKFTEKELLEVASMHSQFLTQKSQS